MKSKILDEKAMQALADLGKSSGTNLLNGLVELLEDDCSAALRKIKSLLERDEFSAIYQAAHTMKSACANLGALAMRDLFARIEDCRTKPDAETLRRLLAEAERAYEATLAELKKFTQTQ